MIVKSFLDISNGKKATRNPKACGSILEQFLSKLIPFNFFIHNSSFDIELDDFIKIAVNEWKSHYHWKYVYTFFHLPSIKVPNGAK